MRRLLLCSGVHGRTQSLEWLRTAIALRHPEAILFAGGVFGSSRRFVPTTSTEWGLRRDDALFLERFFETLGRTGIFTAIVPGPMDTPMEDFLRLGMHAEIEFPHIHLAHGTLIEKDDVAICGVGGCLVEQNTHVHDFCSRSLAEYYLRMLWAAKQPTKILLLPVAPTGPLGGPDGSCIASHFIDSYHPRLCVVGGNNQCRGVDYVAHTSVVNPGCLSQGWAAWLDWRQPVENQVQFLDLCNLDRQFVDLETSIID